MIPAIQQLAGRCEGRPPGHVHCAHHRGDSGTRQHAVNPVS